MPINEEYIFTYDDYLAIKYAGGFVCVEESETDEDRMEMLEKIQKEMKSKAEQEKILYYFANVYGRMLESEDKKKLDEFLEGSEDKMTMLEQSMIEERKAIARKSREEGRTQGRTQGRAEVAQNLLKIKMPIEQIMKVTGLKKEEVEKLEKVEELKEKV